MIDIIISSTLQVLLTLIICYVFFVINRLIRKTKVPFSSWVGLKRVSLASFKSVVPLMTFFIILTIFADVLLYHFSPDHKVFINTNYSPFMKLWNLGFNFKGIITALFYSFFQTGLSEELLFRGLILGQLTEYFGENLSNIIQSLSFSMLHFLLLYLSSIQITLSLYISVLVLPFFFGLIFGKIKLLTQERSIFPSMVAHAIGNFIAYLAYFIYL